MKPSDQYWAGILDGEGCVTIKRQRRPHMPHGMYHQLMVRVQMVNAEIPALLKQEFGGTFRACKPRPNCQQAYEWTAASRVAEAFLRRVRPHLVVKAGHVDLAFEFQNTIGSNAGRQRPALDVETFKKRENFKERIAAMNLRKGFAAKRVDLEE